MIDLSVPRDLGEILSTCWRLYRRHFGVFAVIALAVVLPMDLITLGLIEGKLTSGFDVDQIGGGGPAYTLVETLITTPLITAGHVFAVLQISQGEQPRAGDSLSRAGEALPLLIGTVLLYSLGVLLGLIALIVPGIYLAVRWYVSTQAVVAEQRAPVEALQRSGELTRGQWWRVLGIVVVVGLLGAVAGGLMALPVGALAAVADSGALLVLGNVIADSVILSFTALAGTLLFFDLRVRQGVHPF